MKITNKYNLPLALYEAICRDEYTKAGRFSATGLAAPPQATVLKKRHDDRIVKDASDFLWIIQGKSIHEYLAKHDTENALKEEQLVASVGGVTISGTTDLYDGDIVTDWKVTSVWSFMLGGLKPEWEAQLNVYRWLWMEHGFDVHKLQIHAILRDHTRSRVREPGYPEIPFQTLNVPLWDVSRTLSYMTERISLHLGAEVMADEALPSCTPEEQWMRPTTWAVMKAGKKRALRVFDNREEADKLAHEQKAEVVERPGRRIRCADYCDARPFCFQFRSEAETAEDYGFEVS